MTATAGICWISWMLVATAAADSGDSWSEAAAKRFSSRLAAIKVEAEAARHKLPELPAVPVADQGGTGGFAILHPSALPADGRGHSMEVRFSQVGQVDLVALVPARRYGVGGLEPQFGMPEDFAVELLNDDGSVVRTLVRERDAWADPVRAGHPFVYRVEPTVEAAGVRITAGRLREDPDASGSMVHAWAEAFAFEGEKNLALGGRVTSSGGTAPAAPWQWSGAFLVDGLTPLGLPEMPAGVHENVGWMSEGKARASDRSWVELDFGEERTFDAIRLIPAKRPTADLPSGFGFPRRFVISGPQSEEGGLLELPVEMANPGHNPVRISLGQVRGRVVRIEATELWKAYESFPAFFALSEVEALDGEKNIAAGAVVRSSGGMGAVVGSGVQYWISSSLSDGFGPEGKLVSQREWLLALDARLALERHLHDLAREATGISEGWRRAGWTAAAALAVATAFLLIILPVRFRLRSKREVARVRERIAGDLHDEVGSNLGSIQMLADLAEGHAGENGPTRELKRIQRIAAETVSAVRDIVWLLRPQGGHRIGTVEHLRETSSIMLEPLEWEFTANEAAWQCEMSDEASRHLFLFFREALHNLLRHSGASRAKVGVECDAEFFRLTVSDDGSGIPEEKLSRPSTLRALRQRVEALGAGFEVDSSPGKGTHLLLSIPLDRKRAARVKDSQPGIASG